jgi:hypothetical protein
MRNNAASGWHDSRVRNALGDGSALNGLRKNPIDISSSAEFTYHVAYPITCAHIRSEKRLIARPNNSRSAVIGSKCHAAKWLAHVFRRRNESPPMQYSDDCRWQTTRTQRPAGLDGQAGPVPLRAKAPPIIEPNRRGQELRLDTRSHP